MSTSNERLLKTALLNVLQAERAVPKDLVMTTNELLMTASKHCELRKSQSPEARKSRTNELAKKWQKLLRRKFPTIIVLGGYLCGPEDDGDSVWLDVFCIPDDKMRAFMQYRLAGRHSKILDSDSAHMITHSMSATKQYYPEVLEKNT